MIKVLIIRFSSIGDIVLTTPIIRCLKKEFGERVSIDYLTKKQYASLLEANPYLNTIYTIEESTREVQTTLKENAYDYIVDLHKNVRSKRIAKKLSGAYSTFFKLNKEKWLLTNFKVDRMPNIHIVDRYFEALTPLGVRNDGQGIDYFIPENAYYSIEQVAEDMPFIAVAIGAQFATKQMPFDKTIAVLKKTDMPLVLLGGKDDEEKALRIEKALENREVVNLCGKLNLNQSASVLKQAKVLLTHDTGLMHIAAAFGIKIVSVWGNTVPKLGMYAYLPKNPSLLKTHEVSGLSCRPCSKIGYQKCPKKHFKCMQLQDEDAIAMDLNIL